MDVKQFFKENPKPTPNQIINFIVKQKNLYTLKTMAGNYITTTSIDLLKTQPEDGEFIKFADVFNDTGYIGELTINSRYIAAYYKINQDLISICDK